MRFGLSGLANTAVGFGTIVGTARLGANAYTANAAGYAVGLVFGYVVARSWTFSGRKRAGSAGRYGVAFASAFGFNVAVLRTCLEAGVEEPAAQATAMVSYSAAFYVLCRTWVFRP